MSERVPVYLLAGFLGAGKTTLLNRLLRSRRGRRIGALVNDFGKLPIDVEATRARFPEGEVAEVRDGSIFCACRAEHFVDGLRKLAEAAPEAILVESSGVADPSSFARILADPRVAELCRPAAVVVIADAAKVAPMATIVEAIPRQLKAATLVLVNKTDLADEKTLDEARRIIREHNPTAPIVETVRADLDVELVWRAPASAATSPSADTFEGRPGKFTIAFEEGIDGETLREFLTKTLPKAWRIKGTWDFDGEPVAIDDAGDRLAITPSPSSGAPLGVDIIAPKGVEAEIARAWRKITRRGASVEDV